MQASSGLMMARSSLLLAMLVLPCGLCTRTRPTRGVPKARQSLGQNFLRDVAIAKRISESLDDSSDGGIRVMELGPGQGALTGHLLARFPRMTAIEIDDRMMEHLFGLHPDLTLERGDMLEIDLEKAAVERGGRLGIISNTPYYLTSPLLFKLLASVEHVHTAVLTTQREVADKILSPPSTKQYGILSVMLQLFGQPERLFEIAPEAFAPVPKVSSTVLRFSPTAVPAHESEPLTLNQRAALLGVLKMGFEQRRKMLRSGLRSLLQQPHIVGQPSDEVLAKRPEQLSPAEWLDLARTLFGSELVAAGGDRSELIEGSHTNPSWRAHKAGWKM